MTRDPDYAEDAALQRGMVPEGTRPGFEATRARGVSLRRPRWLTREQRKEITDMLAFQKSIVFESVARHRETVAEGNVFERSRSLFTAHAKHPDRPREFHGAWVTLAVIDWTGDGWLNSGVGLLTGLQDQTA